MFLDKKFGFDLFYFYIFGNEKNLKKWLFNLILLNL